ncbi:MAG TPA: SMI1/KNR4 family protein [Bacillota bacterium]|nr:SMI1/KNR4 family protein [Bacillota bacterium]
MSIDLWNKRWQALEIACKKNGATDRWDKGKRNPMRMLIGPPADEQSILQMERKLSRELPRSFRNVIGKYSADVDIAWQLRASSARLPKEFDGIFSGEVRWSLLSLPDLFKHYNEWITVCFFRTNDPYDSIWHNKFPILNLADGDMIGIETGENRNGAVIYLSHEDGEGHGYVLGNDFEDYIDRLSLIGGVGAEDYQWLPFTSSKTTGIDPYSEAGQKWREWFGLEFPN